MALLGDAFSNVSAAMGRIVSTAVDTLSDVSPRAWAIIGVVAVTAHLLWIRRAGR